MLTTLYKKIMISMLAVLIGCAVAAQVHYPYASKQFLFAVEGKNSYLSYMDVQGQDSNGKTIILFHGKNFSGYYWKDLIPLLG